MVFESCKYVAICPGSLMIMGEHAVLRGSSAVVAAIDKYVSVELIVQKNDPALCDSKSNKKINNQDINITITTDILKFSKNNKKLIYNTNIEYLKKNIKKECKDNKYFSYVLGVINHFYRDLVKDYLYVNNSYIINISSEINPNMGLGSSAAVTAATIAVFLKCLNYKNINTNILKIGYKVINQIQGSGSGADLAASVYGKVIKYKILNHEVKVLAKGLPLVVVYSGYKLSTKEVLKIMAKKTHGLIYKNIFDLMDKIVEKAQKYIKTKSWQELGQLFNLHYGLQESLGVSDEVISGIIYNLRHTPGVYGAKISGSGLGDCVIGLADKNNLEVNVKRKMDRLGTHKQSKIVKLDVVTTDVGLRFL